MELNYFRVTMLQSWTERLRAMEMPEGLVRVAVAQGPTECNMVVRTRADNAREFSRLEVSDALREKLDGYEGWMRVEPMSREMGEAIEDVQ